MTLDKRRDYGIITPPWKGASFKQGERYFDAYGDELDIETGKIIESAADAPESAGETPAGGTTSDEVRDLIALARSLPLLKLAVKASVLLGTEDVPTTKSDIIAALDIRARELKAAEARKPAAKAKAKAEPKKAPEPTPVAPAANGTLSRDDLAAWGRGKARHIMGDVIKAIHAEFGRTVTSKAAAVDALIDAGIISTKDAMQVEGRL